MAACFRLRPLVLLRSQETHVIADSLPTARLGSVDKCMGCRGSSPLTAVERRQDIRRNRAGAGQIAEASRTDCEDGEGPVSAGDGQQVTSRIA